MPYDCKKIQARQATKTSKSENHRREERYFYRAMKMLLDLSRQMVAHRLKKYTRQKGNPHRNIQLVKQRYMMIEIVSYANKPN